jgi:nitroimidazol reductase NimA-like FMN-containing flavoprotein (pyridoxamine 5'-phosphate oxidase superfamily)
MTSRSRDAAAVKPPILQPDDRDRILQMTLISNLATLDDDGGIHVVSMWFMRVDDSICIPTSQHTHKYRNLRARPRASVMIDVSREGLNLQGVLIRGRVDLIEGEEAKRINHAIHLRYVTEAAFEDPDAAAYLGKGDDITIKVHMDKVTTWNLADSAAGKALRAEGRFRALDG